MGKAPHINAAMIEEGRIYPQMDGKFVFKNAITRMPQVVREALEKNNLKTSDIDLFLFHQANLRINEMVAHQLGIKPEQTHNNIEKYGNCSAASIPILIDECVQNGKLKRNKLVCLTSFGSGFTWGAAIMRWS
jgi:3-oxoacyl-[acyl-carrier-protein] synthase-3